MKSTTSRSCLVRWLRCDHTFDDSPGDTCLRKEVSIRIGRRDIDHAIMGLWPTIIMQSWPSIGLHRIGRSAIFADFFYKEVFFLS